MSAGLATPWQHDLWPELGLLFGSIKSIGVTPALQTSGLTSKGGDLQNLQIYISKQVTPHREHVVAWMW